MPAPAISYQGGPMFSIPVIPPMPPGPLNISTHMMHQSNISQMPAMIPLGIPSNNRSMMPMQPQLGMSAQPNFDHNIVPMSQVDPYSLYNNPKRVLFNAVTKKPQNYRTVPCKKFHSSEGCERGDNCHFIHDFQFQGRPIANFHDWKNTNTVRQKNLQTHLFGVGVATYYPPTGSEPHQPPEFR